MDKYGKRFNEAVAAELRAERGAKQLHLEDLAERSGVPLGTLSRYLKNQRDIPLPALLDICAGLGTTGHIIFDRAEARLALEESGR